MALRRASAKLGRKAPAAKRLPRLLAFTDPVRSGDLAARLVVQTGDLRKYANLLLRKGVISTD